MELSESVQRGLQSLADASAFDQSSFPVLVDVSFRSLLSSHADPAVLGEPLLLSSAAAFVFLPLLPVSLRVDVWRSCLDVCSLIRRCCVPLLL